MAEAIEVGLETRTPLLPKGRVHAGRREPVSLRLGQCGRRLIEDCRGEPLDFPGPRGEVVQRFLCTYGFTVVAEEECLRRRISGASDEFVVIRAEGNFA